jgi:hypothetical protein
VPPELASSPSNRDVHALAGIWYRHLITTRQDDPDDPDMLDIYQDHLRDGLAFLDPESDGIEREPYDPKQAVRILSRSFNIDEFLAAHGLGVDEASRIKLIEQVAIALILGAETLKRRAHGDYGVDEVAKRFPSWKEKKDGSLNGSHTRLADLLEGWAKESDPAQATIDLWRSHVASFTSYIGKIMRVRSYAVMSSSGSST